jgi:predicted phosphodiesterase
MKPIKTKNSNAVLKGSGNVIDLPITRLTFTEGPAVESCWQLSEEELEIVKETGKIYFICMGHTHPPILLSAESYAADK